MKLVDVHAHLTFERFEEDLEEVIERARKGGFKIIIASGVGKKSNREVLKLSKKYSDIIKASFGIYPVDAVAEMLTEAKDDVTRDLEIFNVEEELEWIKKNKEECVAIGEVGLDYKMVLPEEARKKQKEIFRKVIDLAKLIKKPLVIHSRNAESDVLEILKEENFKNADLHCFSGNKNLIKKGVGQGLYFSIPAVITRLEHFKMLVEIVPLTQILTETDAPYLSAELGKRSEPIDVKHTIREIAKIKKLSEEEVSEQIYQNAKNLLKI
ncbi:MAG: TatD family hydrolase [Nanoarchaeota archaeon]